MSVSNLLEKPEMPTGELDQTPTGLRERQRVARTGAIIQGAFDLIAEHGYAALTMEDLAAHVGISRPTLYHHFPNKDAIALRALVTLVDQGSREVAEIGLELCPIQRLEKVAHWMLNRRFRPYSAAFVKARQAWLPLKAHPEYIAAFERRGATIRQIIEAGQAAGEIRPEIPSGLIVQMFLGLLCESNYEDFIETGTTTTEAASDDIVSVLIQGVQAC